MKLEFGQGYWSIIWDDGRCIFLNWLDKVDRGFWYHSSWCDGPWSGLGLWFISIGWSL